MKWPQLQKPRETYSSLVLVGKGLCSIDLVFLGSSLTILEMMCPKYSNSLGLSIQDPHTVYIYWLGQCCNSSNINAKLHRLVIPTGKPHLVLVNHSKQALQAELMFGFESLFLFKLLVFIISYLLVAFDTLRPIKTEKRSYFFYLFLD